MRCCNHCMTQMNETSEICPKCGRANNTSNIPVHHLLPGTILNGKFYVGEALGEGGFGITYIGLDTRLNMKVAIKEFYPNGCVTRNNTYSPQVTNSVTDDRKDFFEKGKIRFLQEAQVLARFSDEPGIVGVRDFFEENNTAYIIMEYLDGITLKDYLKNNGVLSAEKTVELLMPVMMSLKKVHAQGMIHRDISPDNIMLVGNKVKLLDFGAARNVSANENKSLSIMLKPGYAPEEQYRSKGHQGPWTDVYALCATMYKCITGITPDDATQRVFSDEVKLPSMLGIRIPKYIENTIMRGMAVQQTQRFQSIDEMIRFLNGSEANSAQPVVQRPVQNSVQTPVQSVPVQPNPYLQSVNMAPSQPPKKSKTGLMVGIIVGLLAIVCSVVAIILVMDRDNSNPTQQTTTKTKETITEEATTEPATKDWEYKEVNEDFSRYDVDYDYLNTENLTVQIPVCNDFEGYGFDEMGLELYSAQITETPAGKYEVELNYECYDYDESVELVVTVWYDSEDFTCESMVALEIQWVAYFDADDTGATELAIYDESLNLIYTAYYEDDVCTYAATSSGYSCSDDVYYDANFNEITLEEFEEEMNNVLEPLAVSIYGY